MTCIDRRSLMAILSAALFSHVPSILAAQQPHVAHSAAIAPSGTSTVNSTAYDHSWLYVEISIPVSLTNLHPDVNGFSLNCSIHPSSNSAASTFADDVTTKTPLTSNSFSGTVVRHWHIHSPTGVAPGTVWTYGCALDLYTSHVVNGIAAAQVNQVDWTRVASGTGWVTGDFTLR